MVNHPNRSSLNAMAYRAAHRAGLAARKSRDRRIHYNNRGGFQLIDPLRNEVIRGVNFDMSPEDVIAWCKDLKAVP